MYGSFLNNHFYSSVPMSVRVPLSSGKGIANRWLRYRNDAPNSPSGPPYGRMLLILTEKYVEVGGFAIKNYSFYNYG